MEISNSIAAAAFFREKIKSNETEEFWAIALNSLCVVLSSQMLFKGTVDSCLVHPRDVFRFALFCNASSLIVGHNHPSGACFPSKKDLTLSHSLKAAGDLLLMPVLDHVIIADVGHYSFADQKWALIPQSVESSK